MLYVSPRPVFYAGTPLKNRPRLAAPYLNIILIIYLGAIAPPPAGVSSPGTSTFFASAPAVLRQWSLSPSGIASLEQRIAHSPSLTHTVCASMQMDIRAEPAVCNDELAVQFLVEGVGQAHNVGSPGMEDAQDTTYFDDEGGHDDNWKGCKCGRAPNIDGSTANLAWCTFGGLRFGMMDDGGDPEGRSEPTYRDLKHVKECVVR